MSEAAPERKGMKVVKVTLFALVVAIIGHPTWSFSGEPPLSTAEIAEIFGYPAQKLKVTDQTEEVNRRSLAKGYPPVKSSHLFSGVENTFAPVTIYVTGNGLLLTDELQRYVEKTIGKARETKTGTPLTRLKFGDVGTGIGGLGMAGPGGSQEKAIITLPNGKVDVGLTVSIPGDPPLSELPEAEAYYELVTGKGVRERLVACLNKIASKAAGRQIEAVQEK